MTRSVQSFSFVLAILATSTSIFGAVGCVGGAEQAPVQSSENAPADQKASKGDTAESSSATEPTEGSGSSVGPQCSAYLECCDEVVKAQPAAAGSCDSTRSSIDKAVENGASTASYESACKQALSTMKSAGYCK